MGWETPSARIQELIRQCAHRVLDPEPEWLAELDTAVLGAHPTIAVDPELAAAVSRSNRANLVFWATANLRHPGAPVPPNTGPEPMGIARELVRRGFDAYALDAYRVGQGVAWRRFMEIAFELTTEPAELHELLDLCARSVSAFIDATLAAIATQIDSERDELTRGTHATRRETVSLILDGAPITRSRAEGRLGYPLTGRHTAAVLWSVDPAADLGDLDRAGEAFGRAAGGRPVLSVLASSATRWVWAPGRSALDIDGLRAALQPMPHIHIALGAPGDGVEGFRRSHFGAVTTQHMMTRLDSPQRIALFGDIELVAILTQDPDRANAFISRVLGPLEFADAEMQNTVRTFVTEGCNASRAADRLFLHRNTLLRRLTRADTLLPRPLQERSVQVAVALEALRWRGHQSSAAST